MTNVTKLGQVPIEIEEGWLVLTHGVGAKRRYSIGAGLLDKVKPTKDLGRAALVTFQR